MLIIPVLNMNVPETAFAGKVYIGLCHVFYSFCMICFSSPEPKAHGELIVYRSIRRPSVRPLVRPCVNIFKLKYLRNQWANRNQILSEASLGWGIDCIRFWTR